jgi:hypothetical protein
MLLYEMGANNQNKTKEYNWHEVESNSELKILKAHKFWIFEPHS